jgi:hypothetical protein
VSWRLFSNVSFLSTIVFSWLAAVLMAFDTNMISEEIGTYNYRYFSVDKSIYYYLMHGMGIVCAVLSGVSALLNHNYKYFPFDAILAFCILQIFGLTWFAYTYVTSEYYDLWQAIGSTGFMVWLSTIVAFAAVDPRAIDWVKKTLPFFVYLTLFLFLLNVLSSDYIRVPGASRELRIYLILWWFVAWFYLNEKRMAVTWVLLREVPFLMLLIGALYIQSRSWFLLTLMLFLVRKKIVHNCSNKNNKLVTNVVYSLAVLFMVAMSFLFIWDVIMQAASEFAVRLMEDTRSNQYVYFFQSISPWELIIGLGPEGTWFWPGRGDYQFIDNGILWLLFIGGLPVAFSYLYFIVWPSLKLAKRLGTKDEDSPAIFLIILYLVMLLGLATYMSPSVSIQSYFVYMLVGQCYWLLYKNGKGRND